MTTFRDELAGGDPRSLGRTNDVVATVLATPARLNDLLQCVLTADDAVVRMRAGDALEKVCRANPALLKPHVELLLGEMAEIDQHSVQWHVAQMLTEVLLTADQRKRAVAIVCDHLEHSTDWIVLNNSLNALAAFTRDDPALRELLVTHLRRAQTSTRKSLVSRAHKLLAEFRS